MNRGRGPCLPVVCSLSQPILVRAWLGIMEGTESLIMPGASTVWGAFLAPVVICMTENQNVKNEVELSKLSSNQEVEPLAAASVVELCWLSRWPPSRKVLT